MQQFIDTTAFEAVQDMKPTINAIFRPYSSSDALRSDRSAGDRQRHRQKVREAVRENIADLIAEESIIGKNKDKVIKVPIRGVKEYRFIYGGKRIRRWTGRRQLRKRPGHWQDRWNRTRAGRG